MEIKQQDVQDHDGHAQPSTLNRNDDLASCFSLRISLQIAQTKIDLIVSTLEEGMADERKCKYHSDTAEKHILTFVFQLVLSM